MKPGDPWAVRAVIFDLGETLLDSGGVSPDFVRDEAAYDFRAVHGFLVGQGYAVPAWPRLCEAAVGAFRRQLEWITKHCRLVRLSEVTEELAGGPREPRAVAITFDDACRSYFETALPILRELGIPSTLFVPVGWIGPGEAGSA